jgi:hypothetical protein
MKDKITETLFFLFIICMLWIGLTSLIYGFFNTDKTQTQIFLHIPKSFILDFKKVN